MKNTDLVQLLRELGQFCEDSTLEGASDLAGRAYTAAAEETDLVQLLEELADELLASCKTKPIDSPNYKRQSSLMQRARKAAERIERQEVVSGAAMTCSLLAQYQSEVDVIESVAGFTDESTPVGEAWARICGVLDRVGGGEGKS